MRGGVVHGEVMRHSFAMLVALSTFGCTHLSNEQLVVQVTQTEQVFAKSMADRNPVAFVPCSRVTPCSSGARRCTGPTK